MPCTKCCTAGRGERGAGHLKAIVFTLILASAIYVGFKVIPLLVNEYQFQDGMQTIARFASVNREPSDKIRAEILKEAQKDDVPVQADDIKIVGSAGNVRINVDYSVTADLGVYQWTLNFHPKVTNDALF
jgi:predicted membrane protein